MQQKRSKTTFGFICALNKVSVEHDFMKEALREIFGLFIAVSPSTDKAIDRFPVLLQQKPDQSLVLIIVRFANRLDE